MDQIETDIAAMRAQGAEVALALKVMGDTLSFMGAWMSRVDNTIDVLKTSIDAVVVHVMRLKTDQTPVAVARASRPNGLGDEQAHQGPGQGWDHQTENHEALSNSKCQQMLILVDSGSSSNFISAKMVKRLKMPTMVIAPAEVTIANGGTMSCQSMVPEVKWQCQGHTFATDLRVL
ncbi:hypothetical protein QYE76_013385 [Lolium multiflorum]|uniref:Uncharacterized protein n=1 Tax=Lolium multiflorum TaxID=4521 RepID=A0AAD8U2W4_LOLMU|nr:hypothetical protein QYE76_013385 [Lolium multiflorum]